MEEPSAEATALTSVEPAFLRGRGEMAEIIRTYPWEASALGMPERWPQALRAALAIMLNTGHPMYLLWGPDLLCFYNDAFRPSVGLERHPHSIGKPAREVWAEVWDVLGPQIEGVMRTGVSRWYENEYLPITRNGVREAAWWTYSHSPVHDETAAEGIGGVLAVCRETTSEVQAERRRDALLALDKIGRDISDPTEVSVAAANALGEALGACRVGYGTVDAASGTITVGRTWSTGKVPDVAGRYRFEEYGTFLQDLRRGSPVAVNDVFADERTLAAAPAFQALGTLAFLDVPLIENEQFVANVFVHSLHPRRWAEEDIALVQEFAQRTRSSVARREAEATLTLFVQNAPAAVAMFDREMRYMLHSKRYVADYQLSDTSLIGRSHYDVFPDLPDHWRDVHRRVMAGEEVSASEDLFLRADGRADYVRWTMKPWRLSSGAIGGAILLSEVVTDTVETRARLNDSEQRYRAIFNRAALGLARVAFEGARFVEVNDALCDLLGYSREELLASPWTELTHPEDVDLDLVPFRQMARGEIERYTVEKRFIHKSGLAIWCRLSLSLVRDSNGQPDYEICLVEDITERKAAERNQGLLLRIADTLRTCSDPLQMLIEANSRLAEALGVYCVGFAEVDEEATRFEVGHQTVAFELSRAPCGDLKTLGDDLAAKLLVGHTVVVQHIPGVLDMLAKSSEHRAVESRSFIAVPALRDERLRGFLYVVDIAPRNWSKSDLTLFEALAERILDSLERGRAEERLRESEALARRRADEIEGIYAAAPIGLTVLDRDLRFIRINDRLAEINGLSAAEHIGRTVHEVLPDLSAQAAEALQMVLSGQPVRDVEFVGTTPAQPGVVRSWCENWLPLRDGVGEVAGVIISAEEVTERRRDERALRDREARLQAALEASGTGTFHWDIESGELEWDGALDRLFGLAPGETARNLETFIEMVHPEDRQIVVSACEACASKGSDFNETFRIVRADGEVRWLHDRGRTQLDSSGRAVSMTGACMDVTERRKANQQLLETQRRLDAVLNNASVAIFLMDDRQHCIYMNRAAEELTGYSLEETRDRPLHDVVHHTRPDGSAFPIEECAIDRAFPENANTRGEEIFVRKDGSFYPVAFVASPVRDEASRTIGTIIEVRDISEEKAALDALAASEARFRTTAEALPGMLFVTTSAGENIYVNKGFRDYTGRSEEELLGPRWAETLHPADVERGWAVWSEAVRTGSPYEAEYRFRRHDGAWRWHAVRALPVRDTSGNVERWVGACVDIHERRVGEDELRQRVAEAVAERETALAQLHEAQKLETIGQMTGGVAHDFNNLLTPIIGSLDLLSRRSLSERDLRAVNGAMEAADRAKTLVQRLLAFARRAPLQSGPVDVAALLTGIRDLIERSVGPTILLDVTVQEALPPARADAGQLELALLNLSINARDAMPNGGALKIHAELSSGDPAETATESLAFVRICVSDSGSGMDEETLRRSIEPFFTSKELGKGTGLGLSMVHGLCAQSGGWLSLSSTVGVGTTAEMWLPVATEHDSAPAAACESSAAEEMRRGRILLVDDVELVRAGTADMIAELGYEVVAVGSAEAALEHLRSGAEVDMLVTDFLMPGMNGGELGLEARKIVSDLPVLVITGYSDSGAIGNDFIRLDKPFRQAELASCLTAVQDGGSRTAPEVAAHQSAMLADRAASDRITEGTPTASP